MVVLCDDMAARAVGRFMHEKSFRHRQLDNRLLNMRERLNKVVHWCVRACERWSA